jgi:hypothetical protein
MKKSLFGLLIAIVAFLCGVLTAGIFRAEDKPLPKPIFEKAIVDAPLFKTAPINDPVIVGGNNDAVNDKTVADIKTQIIYGWYSLNTYETMPEVNTILLSGDNFDDHGRAGEKMNIYAGIYTELSKDIDKGFAEAVWTKFDGNKVSFKTKKLKGIIYRFEGTFFKNKTSGENGEEILRGTLQKFVKGRKVAEASGDFAYSEPYCLH